MDEHDFVRSRRTEMSGDYGNSSTSDVVLGTVTVIGGPTDTYSRGTPESLQQWHEVTTRVSVWKRSHTSFYTCYIVKYQYKSYGKPWNIVCTSYCVEGLYKRELGVSGISVGRERYNWPGNVRCVVVVVPPTWSPGNHLTLLPMVSTFLTDR